jgi:predicted peroxiredoxin
MENFGINLTRSVDDPDRATVAMVIANASIASGKNTIVFLSSEGVRLAVKGVAESIHEEGLPPMAELVKNYAAAGGVYWVCSPCYKKRGYPESDLIAGATLVGAARLVEFMTNAAAGVSY